MRLVLAVAAVCVLTACGPDGPAAVVPPSPSPTETLTPTSTPTVLASFTPSDPLSLIGSWYVSGLGVATGTQLTFTQGLRVFVPCGVLDGGWKADRTQSLLVTYVYGGDSSCVGRLTVRWLEGVRGFRAQGADRLLLDAAGTPVAMLRPGARPTLGPNRAPIDSSDDLAPEQRRALQAAPPALVEGVEPPTAGLLQRRWVPSGPAPAAAYVTFGADGSWTGSDGCNGLGGRYVLGSAGRWLAVAGGSTAIGCDNSPIGTWVEQATRIGVVEGDLVLYDTEGIELGQLSPAV